MKQLNYPPTWLLKRIVIRQNFIQMLILHVSLEHILDLFAYLACISILEVAIVNTTITWYFDHMYLIYIEFLFVHP